MSLPMMRAACPGRGPAAPSPLEAPFLGSRAMHGETPLRVCNHVGSATGLSVCASAHPGSRTSLAVSARDHPYSPCTRSEEAQAAVLRAMERPGSFVLKPQREGGGNNFYDDVLSAKLAVSPRGASPGRVSLMNDPTLSYLSLPWTDAAGGGGTQCPPWERQPGSVFGRRARASVLHPDGEDPTTQEQDRVHARRQEAGLGPRRRRHRCLTRCVSDHAQGPSSRGTASASSVSTG